MVTKLISRIFLSATCLFVFATTSSAQTTFYFPQIADGTFSGGFFATTLLVSNNGSSGAANVTITFIESNGTPFSLGFLDSNNNPVPLAGNVLSITSLAEGQSRKLVSTAASGLTVGFAVVTSNVPVTASAVFSQFAGSPGSGTLLSEAAVVPANPTTNQAIFVDESGNFRTGFAYANPSNTNTATVTFNLINTAGIQALTTARALQPMTHTSIFIDELFESNPLAVNHVGTMRVTSDNPVALMSLRFAGSLFTTIPPFSIAGLMGTVEGTVAEWFNEHALPGPLATFARLIVGIRPGLG